MSNNFITYIQNISTNDYFFTTDHCQKHFLGPDWIPITVTIPYHIANATDITSRKEMKEFNDKHGGREITNPDPKYQA